MTESVKVVEIEKKSVREEERGASMVEYALLVALIAVVAIAAVRILGQRVSSQFSTIAQAINQ